MDEHQLAVQQKLEAKRDWGHAPDYVQAMWLVLQQEEPDDFVVGTGECHSVKEFLEEAFSYVGLDWTEHVRIDQRYFRPIEVGLLAADPTKVYKMLGWEPKVNFKQLVRIMVDADIEAVGLKPPGEGRIILANHGLNCNDRALLSSTTRG